MRRLIPFCLFLACSATYALGLNDTGIRFCGNDTSATITACSTVEADGGQYPRQDLRYGRDAAAATAGQLTKTGAGDAGFDYTKIANNGSTLPATATLGSGPTDWACTKDNVTGLVWEVKTADGGSRDKAANYSWYNSSYNPDGAYHGVVNGGSCSTGHCDTEGFVNDVKATGLCGRTDWRMPTVKELQGIVHFGHVAASPTVAAIESTYFPNTQKASYWSGTPYAGDIQNFGAWGVDFSVGAVFGARQNYTGYVRLVSGAQPTASTVGSCSNTTISPTTPNTVVDNGNGTVSDSSTGLTWKKCSEGQTWDAAANSCTGSATSTTWSDALITGAASTFASHNDWRLPDVKELRGLVEECNVGPAINRTLFPNTPKTAFWTGSPYANTAGLPYTNITKDAWFVYFDDGNSNAGDTTAYRGSVRLVRGGFQGASTPVSTPQTLTVTKTGTGSGSIGSSPTGIVCVNLSCSGSFNSGSSVTLAAAASAGSTFTGWGGACSGTSSTCTVIMSAAQSVTAAFTASSASTNTLTLTKAGAGTGSITSNPSGIACVGTSCSGNFTAGSTVTLTATAGTGSVFSGWTGNSSCSGTGTCTVTMTGAQVVTATFTPTSSTYTLAVANTGSGSGTITSVPVDINCVSACNATFTSGTTVVLTAVADANSTFGGWTGIASCINTGTCSVSMTADQYVTANFYVQGSTPYILSVTKSGTGLGRVSSAPAGINCISTCNSVFNSGASVTLTATAETGSTFSGWGGACSGTGDCVVSMTAAKSVTATFALASATTQYLLTVTKAGTGSGTIASSPTGIGCGASSCGGNFDSGATVTLIATPDTGSSFSGWSGNAACSGTGTCVVVMSAAQNVTATYATTTSSSTQQYTLSVALSGTGSVDSNPAGIACTATACGKNFDSGSSVTLTAVPGSGFTFTGWSGNAACSGTGTCVVSMTAAQSVTASFAAGYTLTVNRIGSGTVSSAPAGINCGSTCTSSVGVGSTVTLTATPDAGYAFTGWSGACTNGSGTCVVTMPASNRSVTANFALAYALTVNKLGTGSGNISSSPDGLTCSGSTCSGGFSRGNTVTLTATPASGSVFSKWDGFQTGSTYPVSMSADRSASAAFVLLPPNCTEATCPLDSIFSGARSEYGISQSGSRYTVTDRIGGRDGSRAVTATSSLNHLYFSDASVNLAIQAKAASIPAADLQRIEELYIAFFNRVPDADGLAYWIDQYKSGLTLLQIADAFYSAAVGQFSSQTGYSATMTNTAFVSKIYLNVLGRANPDSAGLNYWLAGLADGSQTRGSLVNTILTAAHSYKGNADTSLSAVADLLDNKFSVASLFAVGYGLSYYDATVAITTGTSIASAVTSNSTAAALALIGFTDTTLTAPTTASANIQSYQASGSGTDATSVVTTSTPLVTPVVVSVPAFAPGVGPFTGLWGKADEPGWGLGITQHGNTNFVVTYSYDPSGQATWYAMPSCPLNGASCSGEIFRVAGGTVPTQPWNGGALAVTGVGSGTLTFADADNATYSFTLNGVAGAKSITRRSFAAGTVAPAVDYTDLWWSPSEPGWGVTLTQQYGMIFAALHSYGWAGQPTWYVASSCPLLGSGCSGDLYQVAGGYPLTSAWYGTSKAAKVGTISFAFSDAGNGIMSYSINRATASRAILRQPF